MPSFLARQPRLRSCAACELRTAAPRPAPALRAPATASRPAVRSSVRRRASKSARSRATCSAASRSQFGRHGEARRQRQLGACARARSALAARHCLCSRPSAASLRTSPTTSSASPGAHAPGPRAPAARARCRLPGAAPPCGPAQPCTWPPATTAPDSGAQTHHSATSTRRGDQHRQHRWLAASTQRAAPVRRCARLRAEQGGQCVLVPRPLGREWVLMLVPPWVGVTGCAAASPARRAQRVHGRPCSRASTSSRGPAMSSAASSRMDHGQRVERGASGRAGALTTHHRGAAPALSACQRRAQRVFAFGIEVGVGLVEHAPASARRTARAPARCAGAGRRTARRRRRRLGCRRPAAGARSCRARRASRAAATTRLRRRPRRAARCCRATVPANSSTSCGR